MGWHRNWTIGCLVVVAALSACGSRDGERDVVVSIPWPMESAYPCADESASLSGMIATLHASGAYPPASWPSIRHHAASGKCGHFRAGTWLYLLLAYTRELTDPSSAGGKREVPLAYGIQYVDLTVDALRGEDTELVERDRGVHPQRHGDHHRSARRVVPPPTTAAFRIAPRARRD